MTMIKAQIKKGQVADVYSRVAPLYDAWAWLTESKARDRCLELAAIQDGEDVLEVAVGTGLAFERILKLNPSGRTEGVDLTEAMLEKARQKAAKTGIVGYRLRLGDAYELDFADDSFDVLINNYMFDLIPQQDFAAVLQEFDRFGRSRKMYLRFSPTSSCGHTVADLAPQHFSNGPEYRCCRFRTPTISRESAVQSWRSQGNCTCKIVEMRSFGK